MAVNPADFDFYEAIEEAFKARLQPLADAGYIVETAPEDSAGFDVPFRHGRVRIVYRESEYDAIQDIGVVVQGEILTVEISIESRVRRGPNGVFALMQAARSLLLGWRPPGCHRKVWMGRQMFSGVDNRGAWEYMQEFKTATKAMEADPETLGPALSEIRFNDETSGDETIINGTE